MVLQQEDYPGLSEGRVSNKITRGPKNGRNRRGRVMQGEKY